MKNNINVSFVLDENYFKHMLVTIESIISNTEKENYINFFILDLGIDEKSIAFIKNRYLDYNNISFEFVKVNNRNLSKYNIKTHVSTAAYAKIYLSDIIKVEKLIYLDCDLIFNNNILELWNQFEQGVCIKAVWNPFYDYDNEYLGVEENCKTFNSGVMLLNLDLIRDKNSAQKLQTFLDKYHDKTKLHDQAAFNAVFKDSWCELDPKWNCQVTMLQNYSSKLKISKEEYYNLYKNANIIHFTSNSKPWQFRNSHPYKYLYLKYYKVIFGPLKYRDLNLKSFLQKIRESSKYYYYYILNVNR
jgi:lipopolysaccharide biosynthesis glycosyltransferase